MNDEQLERVLEEMRGLNRRIDEARQAKAGIRTPSMAAAIGQHSAGGPAYPDGGSSYLKASLGPSYEPGAFLSALMNARDRDADLQREGKASLSALAVTWRDAPEASKATLGATGATGGFVLPNNFVDQVAKPNVAEAVYADLLTVRPNVNVRGVDQPVRTGAPTRATFQDWGVSKENVNEAYGSYTATLGTLARIMDIGKQYARFSAGAAEQDVIDELQKAMRLGENYYILAGAGTGSVGTGDPTTGVYTALTAVGQVGYTTTFAGASNSTIAGSAANGLITGIKAMAQRSRRPTAAVMDAVTYWQLFTQGSDNAGFFMSELIGAGFTTGLDGSLSFRGIPLLYDPNYDTNTGSTKTCILGDWKQLKLFRGMEFRVDTSDTAGTRWDLNVIGFRGEEEIGINANAAVSVGAFQLVKALIP